MGKIGFVVGIVLAALLLVPGSAGLAQEPTPSPNLLINGGMEGPYYAQGSATRTVPHDWSLWIGAGAPDALPHNDSTHVYDGAMSWNLRQNGAAFTAAGFQRVGGLTPGQTLRASAMGWLFTCNDPISTCTITEPPYRRSDTSANVTLRIGIDPYGGSDPLGIAVKWSAPLAPYDQWAELSVTTSAQAETVTVFLYMTQAVGLAINEVYWDNAVLTAGTGGGSGDVPFVVPQGIRPDGSIVHVVQAGDTLWSITNAYLNYGVTIESIAALNGLRPNARFLQLGQELLILPPGSVDPVTGEPVTPGGAIATPQETAVEATEEVVPLPSPVIPQTSATLEPTETDLPTETPEPTPTLEPTATPEPTQTQEPSPTATPTIPPPTPTVSPLRAESGTLCAVVYEDANLDARRDGSESLLAGAAITAGSEEPLALVSATQPVCSALPPGQYTVRAEPPGGYGLTTPAVMLVQVSAGHTIEAAFGAAQGFTPPTTPPGEAIQGVGVDPGSVAPLYELPGGPARRTGPTLLERLFDLSGLLALAGAVVVAVGGTVLRLILRTPAA